MKSSLILFRLKAMIGSFWLLVFLLLALLFCFSVAHAIVNTQGAESLQIALVDFDESSLSSALSEDLRLLEGVELTVLDEASAQMMLARGNVEGILTIDAGYAQALEQGLRLPLFYDSAGTAASRMAAREMIAGQVIAQRSLLRAYGELGRLGIYTTEAELRALIAEFQEGANPLYTFTFDATASAATQRTGSLFAGYLGFVTLALILLMMTLSQWLAQPDARRVATRMRALPGGKTLSFFADVLLLFGIGSLLILLASLASFSLSLRETIYLFAYLYCITGICLLLSRWQEAGSIDVMAPMIALFTSILGGAFMDLGAFSPLLRMLSLLTPQGQLLYGLGYGLLWPMMVLLAVGTCFLGLCWPREDVLRSSVRSL